MTDTFLDDGADTPATISGFTGGPRGAFFDFLGTSDPNAVFRGNSFFDIYDYYINDQLAFTIAYSFQSQSPAISYSNINYALIDSLVTGQDFNAIFVVQTDAAGTNIVDTINVIITGADDAASSMTATTTGIVTEDGTATATGTITVLDVDAGQSKAFNETFDAVYGVLTVTDGAWSYTLRDGATNIQALAQGEQDTEYFFISSEDGSLSVEVTIVVTGTNDAPVITSAVQTATFTESNAALSANGAITVSDVDAGATSTASLFGINTTQSGGLTGAQINLLQGAFNVAANGNWSYNLASPDFMDDGDSVVMNFNVRVSDGQGGFAFQVVTITINGRDEIFAGTSGNDTFYGTSNDDQFAGGNGFDTIDFSETSGPIAVTNEFDGDDGMIVGPNGTDTFTGIERFVLTSGSDTFVGNSSNETVFGGNGADDIETNGGNDVVFAEGGDDLVHGGSGEGDDYYDGGAGTGDTLIFSSTTSGVVVDMNAINRSANPTVAAILVGVPLPATTPVGLATGAEVGTDAFINFENVTGGSGDDTLIGNAGNNILDGGAGNDLLRGNGGNDTLIGGMGTDTIDYSGQTTAVQVNLTDGSVNAGAQGGFDTVSGIENAILSSANDQFIGDNAGNEVTGGLGNDQIDGGGGFDTAVFVNTVAQDGLATEVEVPGLHALVLGTLSGDGLDTIQNIERLEFRNGENPPVVIDIVNANAVVATVADTNALNESELTGPLSTATGNVLTNDINLDAAVDDVKIVTGFASGFSESSAVAGGTLAGQYGTLTLNANGSYTYTANASTNDLGMGDTYTDTFLYFADDGDDGDSVPSTLTITINGVDDAAVITGATTGSVTEDLNVVMGDITATGTLTATDPDAGESGFVVTTITRPTGEFNIDANGAWSFVADNASTLIQQIGAGDNVTETFTVESIGGTTASVTVTINGVNDNPVAGAVTFTPVPADVLNVAANSANNTLASAIVLTGGTLTANPDIYNSTGVPHITIIAATDNNPDFYTYSFTNVVFNEPGTLFTIDVDDVVGSTPVALSAYYNGSLLLTTTVDRFGAWPNSLPFDNAPPGTDPSMQLGAGSGPLSGTLQFRIGSAASGGAVGLGVGNGYTLHVSLPGGAVLASLPFNGTFEETNAALTTSGNVAFTDIDTNDTPQAAYVNDGTHLAVTYTGAAPLTVAQTTALAQAFSINAAGAFTFNTSSPDYLGTNDVLTLNYTVDITDDHGGSTTQTVTITINGNNDNPVITSAAQTATLTEAVTPGQPVLSASGAVTASDVDNGDGPDTQLFSVTGTMLSYTGPGALTAGQIEVIQDGFVLNDDGSWNYNLVSPEYLAAGASVTLTNTVTVSDGNGGSATQNVVITINGANDAPVVDGGLWSNIRFEDTNATNQVISGSGTAIFSDVDIGNQLTVSKSTATIVYRGIDPVTGTSADVDVVAAGLMTQAQYDGFVLAVSNAFTVADTDGSLTDNLATAAWSFNYTAPTLDFLSANELLTATIIITATDAAGLSATQEVGILLFGTNDGPVLTAGSFAPLVDTAANTTYMPLTGDISALANDLDLHDTESFSLTTTGVTPYGTLTLNADGTYSFAVNSAAVNALQAGTNPLLTFGVRVTDSQGATSDANFTLQVTGANDNPVAPTLIGALNEDSGVIVTNLLIGAFDPDNTDVDFANLTVTVTGNLTPTEIASIQAALNNPMMAVRDPETGVYSFDTSLFNTLDLNETATITFNFNVVDGNGGSVNNTATFTITGALEVITAGLDEFDNGPINGGNFGDLIDGLDGDDVLNGGAGNDHVIGGEGDDIVSGGSGDDNLEGNNGDDVLNGGGGNDQIAGGEGNDVLSGGSGSDTLNAGGGINTVDGGSGSDVLELSGDWVDYDITNVGGVITLTRTVEGQTETVTATNVETFAFGANGDGYSGLGTAAMLANDAPIIAAQTMSVDETPDDAFNPDFADDVMGIWVGNVNATDLDIPLGDQLSYAITLGNDAGNFAIDADGNILLIDNLDFEDGQQSFVLKVVVTDLQGLTSSANITVNLNDLNDAVGPISFTGPVAVVENAAVGTVVATAQAVDPDAGTTVTYSIDDAQYPGAFAINATTGEISVADSSLIDFESVEDGSMGLIIQATSSDGGSSSQIVYVNVSNVAEPIGPVLTEIGSVFEGSAFDGNVIGGAFARPGDFGETATYSLTDDAGGRFTINSENGLISMVDPLLLDFEANSTHSITILATSSDGSTSTLTTVINLSDIANEVLVLSGGDQAVIGGAFADMIVYEPSEGAVFVDLVNNMVMETTTTMGTVSASDTILSTDHVSGFENVVGTNFGDRFYGNEAANRLSGLGGDDYIYGGEGDDVLIGGEGSDLLIGEGGTDTISYADNSGAVYVDLTYGGTYGIANETALTSGIVSFGTAAISVDQFISIENVDGSQFGDRIFGDNVANIFNGNGGNDIIYGGAGNDVINGGDGNDFVIGEAGADTLTGGSGADRFFFSTPLDGTVDTITDFSVGEDTIRVMRGAFGISGADPINVVIDGPAVAANSFIYDSTTGNLSFDADGAGEGAAVQFAHLDGGLTLTAADIVLYG
jgi:VCBS repeat-containing protein